MNYGQGTNYGESTSGPTNTQAEPNENTGGAEAGDEMDFDDQVPNNNRPAEEEPEQTFAHTWREAVNIPQRDLRFSNSTLPPLGNIINASGIPRAPSIPGTPPDDDNVNDYLNTAAESTPYEPIKVKFDNDDPYMTKEDVQDLREAIRDDINVGLNRMLDEIISLQHHQTPTPAPRQHSKKKRLSTNPVRRGASKNERLKLVRKHLATLIGDDRIFTPSVTQEESAAFKALWDATHSNPPHQCCTIQSFRIDILGTPKNAWNRSAARVFYTSFVPEPERSSDMFQQVVGDFHNRVKTIIAEYKKRVDDSARRIALRNARRKGRKYDLFHRRLTVAQTVPQLSHHVAMLESLTIAGMSSDESDTERVASDPTLAGREPRYEIVRPKWRHPRLFAWLHVFDTFHIANRRGSGASVGEWPHARFRNERVPKFSSNPNFIPGLPIDAYDEEWLDTRFDVEFVVRPTGERYDFTHPDIVHA